jgi:hypothetical protein
MDSETADINTRLITKDLVGNPAFSKMIVA